MTKKPTNAIQGGSCDLEGTLVDLELYHFDSFILAAAELGLHMTLESFLRQIPYAIGGGDKRIARGIAHLLERDDLYEEILKAKREAYACRLESLKQIPVRPGVLEALTEIKKLGLPIAIGSLTNINHARLILERSGLDKKFPLENRIFEKDVPNLKPSPDVWFKTAEKMGISPTNQLVFEDSSTGVAAACLARSKVIAVPIFPLEDNLMELIKAGATRIFLDWREIRISALIRNLNEEAAKKEETERTLGILDV